MQGMVYDTKEERKIARSIWNSYQAVIHAPDATIRQKGEAAFGEVA